MSMRYSVQTRDQLVLRDGKPFGEEKNFGGSSYGWVMPHTLAGMVRTTIGFAKGGRDYFMSEESIQKSWDIEIGKIMYSVTDGDRREFLVPPPADVMFTKSGDKICVNQLNWSSVPENCGTDIANADWLVSTLESSEKPAKNAPARWNWSSFAQYVSGHLNEGSVFAADDIGIANPIMDVRIHNGINPSTRTTEDGRLFANKQLYMASRRADGKVLPLEISFEASEAVPLGEAFLGGERKTVSVGESGIPFPAMPDIFDNQKFIKLALLTHGKFGGWCPEWLRPNLDAASIDFVTIPGTEFKVRLRSACVNGWDGVSGWDYASRRKGGNGMPKAMAKLVRPGSIYLLELQDPTQSKAVAEYFWGNSICSGQEKKDGFGLVAVALAQNQVKV
ncbi:MAG: type III-B CRISPR module-associated protein Cmr3 [Fibrobacter sp.]|nr:type III-B CRISPR module-associated protein Cmr3 [Fibrobacter sp.]